MRSVRSTVSCCHDDCFFHAKSVEMKVLKLRTEAAVLIGLVLQEWPDVEYSQ